MRSRNLPGLALTLAVLALAAARGWNPKIVLDDALVRQPDTSRTRASCSRERARVNCHADFDPNTEPIPRGRDLRWARRPTIPSSGRADRRRARLDLCLRGPTRRTSASGATRRRAARKRPSPLTARAVGGDRRRSTRFLGQRWSTLTGIHAARAGHGLSRLLGRPTSIPTLIADGRRRRRGRDSPSRHLRVAQWKPFHDGNGHFRGGAVHRERERAVLRVAGPPAWGPRRHGAAARQAPTVAITSRSITARRHDVSNAHLPTSPTPR